MCNSDQAMGDPSVTIRLDNVLSGAVDCIACADDPGVTGPYAAAFAGSSDAAAAAAAAAKARGDPQGSAMAGWAAPSTADRWSAEADRFVTGAPAVGVAIDESLLPYMAEGELEHVGEPSYYGGDAVSDPWTTRESAAYPARMRAAADAYRAERECFDARYAAAVKANGGPLPAAAPWGVPMPKFEFFSAPMAGEDARPPSPGLLAAEAGLEAVDNAVGWEANMPELW